MKDPLGGSSVLKWAERVFPLAILAAIVVGFYLFGGFEYLELETIKLMHKEILFFIKGKPLSSSFLFLGFYMVYAISSVPGLLILDLLAGYLFGPMIGLCLVLTGATVGAVAVFLATRLAFQGIVLKRKPGIFEKIRTEFHKYPGSYLLFVRIIPFFPFGLVNIALSFLDIKVTKYLWTTFFGILPVSFAYTQLGKGLGSTLEGESIAGQNIFNIGTIIALVSLGLLLLTPILYKKYRKEPS